LGGASITTRVNGIRCATWRSKIPPSEWVTAASGRPSGSSRAIAPAIWSAAAAIDSRRDG
jgi:hypothetical protein